eukprot:1155640-Pelagomonas_calceolata.AAC.4
MAIVAHSRHLRLWYLECPSSKQQKSQKFGKLCAPTLSSTKFPDKIDGPASGYLQLGLSISETA